MIVVVISKTNWNVTTYRNVSNIAFSSGTYTITNAGVALTFSAEDYFVRIMG